MSLTPAETPPDDNSAAVPPGKAASSLLRHSKSRLGFFQSFVALSAAITVALLAGIIVVVVLRAWPAYQQYGWSFIQREQWNPITDDYGALSLIYGTAVTSFLALLIAAPFGIGVAIFLSENLLPHPLRNFFAFIVELLAAIPSVIYGLWGIATVIPLTTQFGRWLFARFHSIPLFSTPPVGPGFLPASLVLAIMILPTIAALSRSSLRAVPTPLTEGAYALGARRWEVLLHVTLPSALTGIFGSIVLALGRAMGETMALAMLVGNNNRISASLLAPGNSIASLLANSFGEASGAQLSALMYLSGILMAMTLLVNLVAQLLLGRIRQARTSP
jgi:phosphate transport system permease protein